MTLPGGYDVRNQFIRRSAFYRMLAASPLASIQFRNNIAVGGGGINVLSKTGMTAVTDAGAVG